MRWKVGFFSLKKDCDIAKEEVKLKKELRTAQRLFQEANERLQEAVKENNIALPNPFSLEINYA